MEYSAIDKTTFDQYSRLILKVTRSPKSAAQISHETKIPIATVYRTLGTLKKTGILKISGKIEAGIRTTLYHNKPQKFSLHNPRIRLILDTIIKNPGIGYRELQQLTQFPFGTLSNSLANLAKHDKISLKRSTRRVNYFPKFVPSDEYDLLINLRKETSKKILVCLLQNKKATFEKLKEVTNRSPSTVSITLTKLVENNLVNRIADLPPYFELADEALTISALQRIEPTALDKMKDRFSDAFSYF